jgi:hypothetical protein
LGLGQGSTAAVGITGADFPANKGVRPAWWLMWGARVLTHSSWQQATEAPKDYDAELHLACRQY